MSDEQDDPRASLLQQALGLAGQIFCARAGEPVMGSNRENRLYDHQDAVGDAAMLMTLSLNADHMQMIFERAGKQLGLPSVWSDTPAPAAVKEDAHGDA